MGTPREDLAQKLREARIAAGYETQSALAKRLNVSRPVISKAENPAQATPNHSLLTAWAGVTGVPLDELTELAERTPERLDELVTARMERQEVIERAHVTAIIDDLVLRRCVGSAQIMAEQCGHLTAMGQRPNIARRHTVYVGESDGQDRIGL
jgi:transcriptional regulator with XRE-family HTH domain